VNNELEGILKEGSSRHIFIAIVLEFALTHSENYEKAQPG